MFEVEKHKPRLHAAQKFPKMLGPGVPTGYDGSELPVSTVPSTHQSHMAQGKRMARFTLPSHQKGTIAYFYFVMYCISSSACRSLSLHDENQEDDSSLPEVISELMILCTWQR